MPLNRQVVSIPMAGSLDTKTDPNQLPIGKLLELENGFRQRNGELIKRNGYETLGTSILPSGTLADGRRMALFGDELNVITNKSMYTYSDDADSWVRKGPLETLSVDQFPIVANSYEQSTADSATNGSIALYAWEDSRTSPASIRYSIIDRSSNSVIVGDTQLVANGQKPRCVSVGNKIMVFIYEPANKFNCYIFNIETPTAAPTSLVIGTDAATTAIADVIPFYGAVLFAYSTTTPSIKLGYVTRFGTLGGGTTGYPSITTYSKNAEIGLTIFAKDDNRFNLVWANATGGAGLEGLRHIGLFAGLDTATPWLAEAQLDSYTGGATTRIRNITGFQSGDLIHTYWDKDNTTSQWLRSVNDTHRRISTGAVTVGAGNLRSVSLAGKAFYADGDGFIPIAFYSKIGRAHV